MYPTIKGESQRDRISISDTILLVLEPMEAVLGMILTATIALVILCLARYTVPKDPAPSLSRIWKSVDGSVGSGSCLIEH